MRKSGVLMPIFSLSSPYGVGTLGKAAHEFVDFLKEAGQSVWQILPIGHTGFGDSPYQSFSSAAGNPYFVDLDELKAAGLLTHEELEPLKKEGEIDYAWAYKTRFPILKKAFSRFDTNASDFISFCRKNADWLEDYALFMAIKDSKNGCDLSLWEKELIERDTSALEIKTRELKNEVDFYKTVQYWFFSQWAALKKYANKNGVKIMGDLPIYVSLDSADVWANPKEFMLTDRRPTAVAGCPPDAFSKTGQLWGNPLYRWDYMKENGYAWWKGRMKKCGELFDMVRIDHFRGFDEFYAIPYGDETAENGKWMKGPGKELFDEIKKECDIEIIAEDLGTLTDSADKMLEDVGFPGMAVLQFAFDSSKSSRYLPHNIKENCVVYVGTHDNDTACGWLKNGNPEEVEFCRKYLRLNTAEGENWGMIKAALATPAKLAILSMQDFMGLSSEARINTPSLGEGNWRWRITDGCVNSWLAGIIKEVTELYGRGI